MCPVKGDDGEAIHQRTLWRVYKFFWPQIILTESVEIGLQPIPEAPSILIQQYGQCYQGKNEDHAVIAHVRLHTFPPASVMAFAALVSHNVQSV